MSGLPKGWVTAKLGIVAEFVMGQAPPGSASNFVGDGTPFVKAGEFGKARPIIREWTTKPLKFAKSSDVLICVVGATSGKINLGADCAIGRSVAAIRPKPPLDQKYLYNFLRTQIEILRNGSVGSAQGVISSVALSNIKIPLSPLPEQRRIVAKLDSLAGRAARARDELERIPRLIQKYRESLITSALSGAWTGDGAKGGWTDCKAKELFTWSSGKFLPKSKQTNGRIPVYGGNGINGTHDRALVDLPTIVVGRVGAQCGNVYLTGGPAWITDNAIFAQTISDRVDPRFALLVLRHSNLNAQSGGTGQPYVNQDNLNDVEFCLPSRQEQHSILQRMEAAFAWLDRVAAEHANASRLLPKLDQAILAKAFRGELVLSDGQPGPLADAERV